jgi:anti-sigma factor RsiW
MDCQTATERMAGWVDGQLSPGEQELMETHLHRCTSCSSLATAMGAQPLAPPSPVILPAQFWDRMDATLQSELSAAPPLPPPTPLLRRRLQLGPVSMAAYAALLLGAIGWGVYAQSELMGSRAEAAGLQVELERERRLGGEPRLASPQGYRTTAQNRTNRGTL